MKNSLLLLLFVFFLPAVSLAEYAQVDSFSPQGVAKKVRQVSARFSEPMLALGAKAPDPFEVLSSAKGQGRWTDARTWVYDYPAELPGGIVAVFRLRAGLKTLAGQEVYGQREFRFTTGGPTVTRAMPYDGRTGIDEDQAFLLTLDDAATPESVTAHSYFMVAGLKDKIGLRLVDEVDRQQILNSMHMTADNTNLANTVIVQAKQVFPTNATVTLVWGRGVKSVSGITTDSDQVLHYATRTPFTVTLSCERENADAGCVPFLPLQLEFSSMVPWEAARQITLTSGSQVRQPVRVGEDTDELVSGVRFDGPFPENSELLITLPRDLRDDSGRVPVNMNRYPLHVTTGAFPPLAKFPARFGIVEKSDPVLPVTLRNVEEQLLARGCAVNATVQGKAEVTRSDLDIIGWLRRMAVADRRHSVFAGAPASRDFAIPKPHRSAAFEVVGIPLQTTGLHVVELKSEILGAALLGENAPMYVPTAALVTNLSAHFKWGRESSLVWVTALDSGAPVPGASVTIRDCKGQEVWNGTTDVRGVATIPQGLRAAAKGCAVDEGEETFWDHPQMGALRGLERGLFAFVHSADDMTFVHSSWNQGLEPWRFHLTEEAGPPHSLRAHTALDRSLLRAGDTVHMKHYLRRQSGTGFEFPAARDLPKVVVVNRVGSQEYYELPLAWDLASGVAETAWRIPARAGLGNYAITLYKDAANGTRGDLEYCEDCWFTGQFKVAEFRVPLMKGVIQGSDKPLVRPATADFDVHLSYLSGGGAGSLPVTLRSMIEPLAPTFDDFEDVTFCNGGVREGIQNRGEEDGEAVDGEPQVLQSRDGELDKSGSLHVQVDGLPQTAIAQTLTSELEFKDPSGEIQTVTRRDQIWPAAVLPGLQLENWAGTRKIRCTAVAVGQDGTAVAGAPLRISLYHKTVYTHRKRLVGGFYAYENTAEIKRVGQVFDGRVDDKGQVQVEIPAPTQADGEMIVQVDVVDAAGHTASVHQSVWLYGDGEWSFEQTDNDRIDLIPERKVYEPGETAQLQVRMPFREATALVTVEREGVIDASVQHLTGEAPVITVPIKPNYGPNVYVSALCVRGRVAVPEATALVDLARPAFKLGIAKIKVGWKGYELDVHVRPEKDTFKVRTQAPVTITVQRQDGQPLPAGAEVAISAVDEGLLELMPNTSWNLLDAMLQLRPYEVETSTAQMQVVGKRHFGLKALPHGGGGGMQTTRELFDTLLLWQGRVRLDAEGQARVNIPLNDSLTSFRIVAVAQAGPALFGTGQTSIRTSQDLMLLSGLPQTMRQGDRFQAVFTVRNGVQVARNITVRAQLQAGEGNRTLPEQQVLLGPGEAREVRWDVTAPTEPVLVWQVTAGDGNLSDTLKVSQKLVPSVEERITQATLAQLAPSQKLDVARPEGSLEGRGGVRVLLSSSLADGQPGVQDYLARYPHSCLEQRLSRAVGLHDAAMWQAMCDDLMAYLDDDGLARYFPSCVSGSDTLTSYVLSMAHECERALPAVARERMLSALDGFVKGRIERRSLLPTKDLMIRKLAALEALSRYGRVKSKDLESLRIEPNLWPTSALLDWISLLDRMPKLPGKNEKLAQAGQLLRARLNMQGTALSFSTERTDDLPWLMTGPDVNALRAVCVLSRIAEWKDDVPKMLRGAIGRQRRGTWSSTVADAWGVVALDRFAGRFESGAVNGTTSLTLAGSSAAVHWDEAGTPRAAMLPWPATRSELQVNHTGTGTPWMTVQTWAAEVLREPRSSGFTLRRSVQPVMVRTPGRYSVGDVIRIHLDCTAQADAAWVAVQDFIPCGATILGQGFDRESRILAVDEKNFSVPSYEERSFTAYRAYYEALPRGSWSVEYTVRLNTAGEFQVPGTRIEALYAPEMYGELPATTIRVE